MISRSGDRVPSGDGAEVDRGTAGADAPATGSARMVIGFAAFWIAAVSFVCWVIFSRQADSLAGITGAAVLVLFWSAGVFSKAFWRR